MKPLNANQQAQIKLLQNDLVVHVVDDTGDAYLTLAHAVRVRIDRHGVILSAWMDSQEGGKR